MSNNTRKAVNHLNGSFYITTKLARQVMTYKDWQETALATNGRILACGETYVLHAKHIGGGMYEVTATPNYWQDGRPSKKKKAITK